LLVKPINEIVAIFELFVKIFFIIRWNFGAVPADLAFTDGLKDTEATLSL